MFNDKDLVTFIMLTWFDAYSKFYQAPAFHENLKSFNLYWHMAQEQRRHFPL